MFIENLLYDICPTPAGVEYNWNLNSINIQPRWGRKLYCCVHYKPSRFPKPWRFVF